MTELVALSTIERPRVEQLLDRAFGTNRHARTAYRLREGTSAIDALSLAACDGATLVGSLQCWPVMLAGDDGVDTPMVLLGPVAVSPDRQNAGIGRALMTASLVAARDHALDAAIMLIGDPDYYGRLFGFAATRTARWRLPGPYEPHRLLARGALVPDRAGLVGPRVSVGA